MSAKIPGRAETVNQKQDVLDKVLLAWIKNPHLRLGQLIMNASYTRYIIANETAESFYKKDPNDNSGATLFFVEDDDLANALLKF